MPKKHEEKGNPRQMWISLDNRKLIQGKYALYKSHRKARSPDDLIGELIDSLRKRSAARP